MTREELLDELRGLRYAHERAEATYLLRLMRCAREEPHIWADSGCDTFEQFMRSNHLGKPERLRIFEIGVQRSSEEMALRLGANAMISLGMKTDPEPDEIGSYLRIASAFVETEKVAPSAEASREWDMQTRPPISGSQHAAVRKLSEIQRLRARVSELEKENAELRAALGKGKKVA